MIDWTKSMTQTYEFYIVDPITWKDKSQLRCVKKCTISRDYESETLGSASLDVTEILDECYIRIYLVAIQNGITYKLPLGTFLVQTPSYSFDGKIKSVTADAYTPLIELKEKQPPLGYYLPKNSNITNSAYLIIRENARAPIIKTSSDVNLLDNFVSNTDDTWLSYSSDLIANAKYRFDVDELGRILFSPEQDTASLQPVWTYTDDNSSILYPEASVERDLYGIPNVVEVVYSTSKRSYQAIAQNENEDSPVSIQKRGRKIVHRVTDPNLNGIGSNVGTDNIDDEVIQKMVEEYANQLLRNISCLEYSITYKHGYNTVRLGDCVRLNYKRLGLENVKAKVISQNISCESGCYVSEKAVYTKNLWR